jgi:sugar lactone lactonase YvrE
MGNMLKSALHKGTLLTVLLHLIGWGGFLAFAVPPASAQFKAWVMAKLPERPWGLGVDSKGNIYTSLPLTGEVVVLKDDGTYDHIAWVPSKEESGKDLIGLVGLDNADNIYVFDKAHSKYDEEDLTNPFHPACRDATATRTGIYKIDAKTRRVTALATKADGWPFCFPHGVAIDSNGNVYMADATYSAIWKISPDGKKVDLWSAHPLLNWPPSPYSGVFFDSEVYLGVSAIAIDKQQKNIYAVSMGVPMVLRIPIKEDGSAGEPQALQPSGYSLLDGVVLDAKGNIYVSEMLRNEIWVLSPDGSQRILIANKMNAPLDNNTGLVLKGDVLCTSNFGFAHSKSEDADRTVVCMKGFSIPK